MKKKAKRQKATKTQSGSNEILRLRLNASGIAELLGLSTPRIHQLRRDGGPQPDSDGLYGVVDALRAHYLYDSPRGEALRARTRATNARALEIEQSVRRAQRRMLTLDELREICVLLFEEAVNGVQAESSRFFSDYIQTHTEQEARATAHHLYDPLVQIAIGWRDGVTALIRSIDQDLLPDAARLDEVLKTLIADIAASNRADQKRLASDTPG